MLQHVRVQNIALIDEASFDLENGLNVLTGETGAGKSILLGSIQLALGSRAGKDIIRDKERNASVELLFHTENNQISDRLNEMGISCEDGELLIARRFTPSGRSSCMINDNLVTTAQVKSLSSFLIDIHGQHEHQSLLDSSRHIELLDRFIPEMPEYLKKLRILWDQAETVRKELDFYLENGRDRNRLLSLMEYELKEIEEADWREGEEEALAEEKKHLMFAERLQGASLEAAALMREEQGGNPSALSLLDDALAKIRSAAAYDEKFFGPYAESMGEQLSILEDIASEMQDYGEKMEADPERLNEIEDRFSVIDRLKEKYGKTREQVIAYQNARAEEYEKLRNVEKTTEELKERLDGLERSMKKLTSAMTALRTAAGKKIETQITEVLATLQFEDPVFKVQREEKKLSPNGEDSIIFMIRTNVGEKIMPLNMIASGGEMSRVMLAIKTVLAEEDEIETMIFDEIDTGISGRTAQSVAEKMSRISSCHQVICITHLPQIAAMADTHLRIEKKAENGHTATHIEPLCGKETEEELSRMLGGTEITAAVRENAAEMKKLADQLKAGWKK